MQRLETEFKSSGLVSSALIFWGISWLSGSEGVRLHWAPSLPCSSVERVQTHPRKTGTWGLTPEERLTGTRDSVSDSWVGLRRTLSVSPRRTLCPFGSTKTSQVTEDLWHRTQEKNHKSRTKRSEWDANPLYGTIRKPSQHQDRCWSTGQAEENSLVSVREETLLLGTHWQLLVRSLGLLFVSTT